MAAQLKASLLIQIYDCPRPSFDATLSACDRPLYDYLAAKPTPERAWQKAERMRIVGDVERARDQAVIDCEASRFPAPVTPPEGVQLTIVTKGVTPAPKPAPKGLTAIVRIDIAPQPPCPAIPFLALVAGVGFRPRMLWQGGRMAFIAPASASSLAQQITLAFDQLLDHQVWYDNDPKAPRELWQRQSPFDLTKQRVDTQGDAAHDHFHVAILYEQIDGAGRVQYDRTLTPNQDRWTLADARTGALGLLETTFDIPVPADLRGSWRQRVILWRFDRGPTPVSVTYDNQPVVAGNSHIWAFDDDEWRETRQKVMEIVRETAVSRTNRSQHQADWSITEIVLQPLPFQGQHLGGAWNYAGERLTDVVLSNRHDTSVTEYPPGYPPSWGTVYPDGTVRGPIITTSTREVTATTGNNYSIQHIGTWGAERYEEMGINMWGRNYTKRAWGNSTYTNWPQVRDSYQVSAIINCVTQSYFEETFSPDAEPGKAATPNQFFAAMRNEHGWVGVYGNNNGTMSESVARERYNVRNGAIEGPGSPYTTASSADARTMPNGTIAVTRWANGNTDEMEEYIFTNTSHDYRRDPDYRNVVYTPTIRPVLLLSRQSYDAAIAKGEPFKIDL